MPQTKNFNLYRRALYSTYFVGEPITFSQEITHANIHNLMALKKRVCQVCEKAAATIAAYII